MPWNGQYSQKRHWVRRLSFSSPAGAALSRTSLLVVERMDRYVNHEHIHVLVWLITASVPLRPMHPQAAPQHSCPVPLSPWPPRSTHIQDGTSAGRAQVPYIVSLPRTAPRLHLCTSTLVRGLAKPSPGPRALSSQDEYVEDPSCSTQILIWLDLGDRARPTRDTSTQKVLRPHLWCPDGWTVSSLVFFAVHGR